MTRISDALEFGGRRAGMLNRAIKGSIVTMSFVPATLDRDGVCAAQQLGAAGNLTLNGALVSRGVATVADSGSYGRCVGVYSGSDLSTINFTVRGFDIYGVPMAETIAGPNNATTAGLKAFWRVTSVYADAAVGSNVEVGTIDKFGLPMYLVSNVNIVRIGWDGTLADNAATVAAGVTTSPATATTGDVRGTIIQGGNAANGSRRLAVAFIPDLTSNATKWGVTQYKTGLE